MNSTRSLLVELLVEELPPKVLKKLGEAFAATLHTRLREEGLASEHSALTSYATPRRLAAHVSAVRAQAADRAVVHKLMPVSVGLAADGSATPALAKKLAALGADAGVVPSLVRRADGKAETLFLETTARGALLAEGLQRALDAALAALPIPKVMSYQLADGWTSVDFVRPAHGLVALHGAEVVPVAALGLAAGRATEGHRFEAAMSPVQLQDADHYARVLDEQGAVVAGFEHRRAEIVRQLEHAAAAEGLKPIDDPALLDEVTALVERPNVLLGRFDEAFLAVPAECLVLTMKANQKYFPLLDGDGRLTNRFLVVSNIRPADASLVVGGNERVVRPRLADAKFFFDQDRKRPLADRVPGLAKVVYHAKLGTMGERVERIRAIARAIGDQLVSGTPNAPQGGAGLAARADLAAQLAKADLLTDMVGEFPELQGTMGAHYARHDGHAEDIAEAVEDHYKPRYAGDTLPRGEVGLVVALADKLETLAGLFGIGQAPSGDKDPFALRRHALGVVRMLVERDVPLRLEGLLKTAIGVFPAGMLRLEMQRGDLVVSPLWVDLADFVRDRAAGYLRERGYAAQEVDAIIHLVEAPAEYVPRLEAVRKIRAASRDAFEALATADKRARNIIAKSPSGEGTGIDRTEEALLVQGEEVELLRCVRAMRDAVEQRVRSGRFGEALALTMTVSKPVTDFFDKVMVNVERDDLRRNRFNLLHEVTGLTNRVADLSKLAA